MINDIINSAMSEIVNSNVSPHDPLAVRPVTIAAGVGGGALGYFFWKEHRWLGLIGGAGAGRLAYNIATQNFREAAEVAVTNAGLIGGSLAWKKHPFLGGLLGVTAVLVERMAFRQ